MTNETFMMRVSSPTAKRVPETAWKVLTKLPTLLSSLLPSDAAAAANADKNQMLKNSEY